MGRFDRNDAHSQSNSEASGSAIETLRSTVERQVREVVEEAMARALAIEDRALAKASQVEQDSRRKADELVRESRDRAVDVLGSAMHRAEGMHGATETLEAELAKVIASFREEIEALTSELRAAKENLGTPPSTDHAQAPEPPGEHETPLEREPHAVIVQAPEPERAPVPVPASEAQPTPPPLPVPEPEVTPLPPHAPEPHVPHPAAARAPAPDSSAPGDLSARDMVRQQLIRLRDDGQPREEAQKYLGRFKQAGAYNDLLNEIYPGPPPGTQRRRGLLRRRQP